MHQADVGRILLGTGGGYVVLVAAMVFISFVDDLEEETPGDAR